jgi:hypothetical protein
MDQGTHQQHLPYNQQYPPLAYNPPPAQPAPSLNHSSQRAPQTSTNHFLPTSVETLSEEESIAVNSLDNNNKNSWQIIKKKRKRENPQPQGTVDFNIPIRNQFQDLEIEESATSDDPDLNKQSFSPPPHLRSQTSTNLYPRRGQF